MMFWNIPPHCCLPSSSCIDAVCARSNHFGQKCLSICSIWEPFLAYLQ